jgi:hypothetical protein
MEDDRDSLHEDLRAGAQLAASKRVQRAAWAVAWAASIAASAVGGWAARTFDLSLELRQVREGQIALTNQQAALLLELQGDQSREGFIPATRRDLQSTARDVALVAGLSLTFEREPVTRTKLAAAEKFAGAYTNLVITNAERPTTALRSTLLTVDVPLTK